jgi:hypothetical protein
MPAFSLPQFTTRGTPDHSHEMVEQANPRTQPTKTTDLAKYLDRAEREDLESIRALAIRVAKVCSAENSVDVNLYKAAAPEISCLPVVLGVPYTFVESLGGMLLSFAAQVHVAPTGPLAIRRPQGIAVIVVLAVLGGLLIGTRQVRKIIFLISICCFRATKTEYNRSRRGDSRKLSIYQWGVATGLAGSRA